MKDKNFESFLKMKKIQFDKPSETLLTQYALFWKRSFKVRRYSFICESVPTVGILKFSIEQKKSAKSASCGMCQLGDVQVERNVPVGD